MLISDLKYGSFKLDASTNKLNADQIKLLIQTVVGPEMWKWLLLRWNDKIFVVKFLFIKKTVRVSDLEQLWTFVFAPQPVPQPEG